MGDGPSLEAFRRHVQVALREAEAIPDADERRQRQWVLEGALQEAILFAAEHAERVRLGVPATRELDAASVRLLQAREAGPGPTSTSPPATTTATSAATTPPGSTSEGGADVAGIDACHKCGSPLDSDLGFCPACGATRK